jgi:hypothetical protein
MLGLEALKLYKIAFFRLTDDICWAFENAGFKSEHLIRNRYRYIMSEVFFCASRTHIKRIYLRMRNKKFVYII